jgi:Domain of unknown function (DUF4112)
VTDDRALAALRRWSALLDSAFRVPGTSLRFGLDPILGLLPGLGDVITPAFSALLLVHGVRLRVPRVVLVRMLMNAVFDFVLGAVPVIGDLFDIGWKANLRNLALLERHARPGVPPSTGDWIFVFGVIGVLAAVAALPVLLVAWAFSGRSLL